MSRLMRWCAPAALLLCVAAGGPLHAATEESARAALDEALPELAEGADAAFFALLASMVDGDELSVRYNLRYARFRCVGDRIEVLAQADEAVTPDGAEFDGAAIDLSDSAERGHPPRAALVVDLDQWLDLDRVGGRLREEYGAPTSQSARAVTFRLPDAGGTLTLTAEGLLCVLRRGAADSLAAVDGLLDAVYRVAEAASQVHVALADASREDLLRRSVLYSQPRESYARAWFVIGPQRLTEGRLPEWTRGLASGIDATAILADYAPPPTAAARPSGGAPSDAPLPPRGGRSAHRRAPRDDRPESVEPSHGPSEARIRVWAVGMGSMPSIKVNGRRVIRGVEGDKGGGEGPPDKHGAADVTEVLRPGENRIETIETPYAAACVVCIELIAPSGASAAFEVAAGRTVQVAASAPLSRLLADWPELAVILAPGTVEETDGPRDADLEPQAAASRAGAIMCG